MRPTSSPIWTRGLSRRNGSCRGHRCDLARKRGLTKSRERPIIFVVHSLGGIVVKSALIHSDTARQYGPISRDFVTKFAYEVFETPTPLGKITVVPRASAVTEERVTRARIGNETPEKLSGPFYSIPFPDNKGFVGRR
ncbi:hypothetical protein CGMCC3_g15845 [Colletotrichum fructicola]|nr:uncharacterized protein CGMCC3_g15845 [Colletotrichum fructicola]KAE9568044.1 hypothetical protein CGMCC3_g15845 [Colletotrichum fructicola]